MIVVDAAVAALETEALAQAARTGATVIVKDRCAPDTEERSVVRGFEFSAADAPANEKAAETSPAPIFLTQSAIDLGFEAWIARAEEGALIILVGDDGAPRIRFERAGAGERQDTQSDEGYGV